MNQQMSRQFSRRINPPWNHFSPNDEDSSSYTSTSSGTSNNQDSSSDHYNSYPNEDYKSYQYQNSPRYNNYQPPYPMRRRSDYVGSYSYGGHGSYQGGGSQLCSQNQTELMALAAIAALLFLMMPASASSKRRRKRQTEIIEATKGKTNNSCIKR